MRCWLWLWAMLLSCAPSGDLGTATFELTTSEDWTWPGVAVGSETGWVVARVGDVDGDGFDDLLAGAPFADGAFSNQGAAYLFLGGEDGLEPSPYLTFEGGEDDALFGTAAAGLGDVDGDGRMDFAIGAPNSSGGGTVRLFLGDPLDDVPDWEWSGGGATGSAVAGVGDVNGDGLADLLVGAEDAEETLLGEGAVHLFLATGTTFLSTPDWSAFGGQADAQLGASAGWAGDINGDGYNDLLAGAVGYDAAEVDEGAAFYWSGGPSLPTAAPNWLAADGLAGSAFGRGIAGVGDTDGDGYGDFVIGAPLYGTVGAAWFYRGGVSGPQPLDRVPIVSGSAAAYGYAVGTPGDLDLDGYADVLLGFPNLTNDGGVGLRKGGPDGPEWGGAEDLMILPAVASTRMGFSLTAVGDSDGDPWPEFAVGEPGYDTPSTDTGRVHVEGVEAPLPEAYTLRRFGSHGWALGGVLGSTASGDLNGDGYDDLAVGALGADSPAANVGLLEVYFGGPDGVPGTADLTIPGEVGGETLGYAVEIGDLDGDGWPELIGGAPGYDDGSGIVGRVQIFGGSAAGPSTTATAELVGTQLGSDFGRMLAAADFGDDGFDDLAIGAYLWDTTAYSEGAIFVHEGSLTGLIEPAAWTAHGSSTDARLGWQMAPGDVNGDGFDDLVASAPGEDGAGNNAGRVSVWAGGPGGLATTTLSVLSGQAAEELGYCVAVGDLDGDGHADVAASRTYAPDTVSVVSGGPTGLSLLDETVLGPFTASFGASCSVGDRNGDGYGDLVVGDPYVSAGIVRTFRGTPDGIDSVSDWSGSMGGPGGGHGQAGRESSLEGDYDGDGAADVLAGGAASGLGLIAVFPGNGAVVDGFVGSPRVRMLQPGTETPLRPGGLSEEAAVDVRVFVHSPFGRARAKLEAELQPAGQPFDGSITTASADWTDTGDGMDLTLTVDGLAADTAHHGRVRVRWDPAQNLPQTTTRWFSLDPSDPTGIHVRTTEDLDGDGHAGEEDCDDTDASIHPEAPELCDTIDSDCDGDLVDEFDDLDGDGDPDCTDPDVDGDSFTGPADCDDEDPSVHDGAPEFCDTIDSDCDGDLADEFADLDDDGDPDCTDPDVDGDGHTATGDDCDDEDDTIYLGATEFCDATDQDCDGDLVEGWPDQDGDLLPDCADDDRDGDGHDNDADCGPDNAAVHPGADEICDGLDSDCDGSIPADEVDADGDGFLLCEETAGGCGGDNDPDTFPGADEVCDEEDNDCDGSTDEDLASQDWFADGDGDGFAGDLGHPGNPLCADPGDGWLTGGGEDCDDNDVAIQPLAVELCDDVDNDCDDAIDDGLTFTDWFQDNDGDGFASDVTHPDNPLCDDPGDGWTATSGEDCDDATADVRPTATETCNGIDDDCSGGADDGLVFGDWFADDDGDGHAGEVAHPDNPLCEDPGDGWAEAQGADCDDDNVAVGPSATEVCNEVDDDCDGEADDGLERVSYYRDNDLDGFAGDVEHPDNPLCADPGPGWITVPDEDCDDTNAGIHPDAVEVEGNSTDEDCDGRAENPPDSSELIVAPGISCGVGGSSGGVLLIALLGLRRRRQPRLLGSTGSNFASTSSLGHSSQR